MSMTAAFAEYIRKVTSREVSQLKPGDTCNSFISFAVLTGTEDFLVQEERRITIRSVLRIAEFFIISV